MGIKKEKVNVYNMTCTSCEKRVEIAIRKVDGVINVTVNYRKQMALIEYDNNICNINKIKIAIKKAGYETEKQKDFSIVGILIIAVAIIFIGNSNQGFDINSKLNGATYFVLFIVGLLTSLHCVGMCGGIMLSQSIPKEKTSKFDTIKPALLYNLGRVIAYTIIGGAVGALGSVLSLSLGMKSALQIFAGIFMIIMGANMAGFGLFRRFNIKLPWSACKVKNKPKTPFFIGMLNGLLPCGPLQTMQLYALGTGSAFKGSVSMFIFALGTVPLMLSFGAFSSLLSKNSTKKILKVSGILVIVLGLIMGRRGLALAGIGMPSFTSSNVAEASSPNNIPSNAAKAVIKNGVQTITMTADGNGYTPNVLYVQKNIPVIWTIDGKQLNSCNGQVVVPSLNIQKTLISGPNIVQFTPAGGDINFSCSMGMIRGVIRVVDNVGSVDASKADPSAPPKSSGMPCCTGGSAANTSSSTTSQKPSIYGSDISKVSTDKLVQKAVLEGDSQNVSFKGQGYEFSHLIQVAKKDLKTDISFDLNAFDNPNVQLNITSTDTGDIVATVKGKKGLVSKSMNFSKAGGYAIMNDNQILGVIEVVDDINNANLQSIRQKYITTSN